MNILTEIERHFGGTPELAKALGIQRQAIYQWKTKIPELRAHQIDRLTAGRFTVRQMRPDLFLHEESERS